MIVDGDDDGGDSSDVDHDNGGDNRDLVVDDADDGVICLTTYRSIYLSTFSYNQHLHHHRQSDQ